ncbi:MAG: membrane protein insertion efficiency factor YidD [Actinomycetota bacterium]|nr:membrane protein insertion efficiency factor YidD [Actinomycetota bacterium]
MIDDERLVASPWASGARLIIRAYQAALSPWLGRNCRFVPSCSQYAYEAIGHYGLGRGVWLALGRLGRCHPFRQGGYDPVPTPKRGCEETA